VYKFTYLLTYIHAVHVVIVYNFTYILCSTEMEKFDVNGLND